MLPPGHDGSHALDHSPSSDPGHTQIHIEKRKPLMAHGGAQFPRLAGQSLWFIYPVAPGAVGSTPVGAWRSRAATARTAPHSPGSATPPSASTTLVNDTTTQRSRGIRELRNVSILETHKAKALTMSQKSFLTSGVTNSPAMKRSNTASSSATSPSVSRPGNVM
jgi:hypothetical protein